MQYQHGRRITSCAAALLRLELDVHISRGAVWKAISARASCLPVSSTNRLLLTLFPPSVQPHIACVGFISPTSSPKVHAGFTPFVVVLVCCVPAVLFLLPTILYLVDSGQRSVHGGAVGYWHAAQAQG